MITAGIDIGSVSTEMVALRDGEVLGYRIISTGSSSRRAAESVIEELCHDTGLVIADFDSVVTTGYGRKSTDLKARHVTELSCHARGAWHRNQAVKTVIDIGGQDSKVIRVGKGGRSVDFVMNDKCAAGTGRFLEVMAHALDVKVEELGPIALSAQGSVQISSMCTVFAESEVVSLIAEGHARDLIIRGIMDSIAARVVGMAHRVGLDPPVLLTGGVAMNGGVVLALREKLGVDIEVPENPQIIGALGAGLIAADSLRSESTRD
jgi:predicted CoA-substrate-specific enzyme activase